MTEVLRKRFAELAEQIAAVEATRRAKYSEFTGNYEEVDEHLLLNWCVKAKNLISNACGKDSQHFLSFLEAEAPKPYRTSVHTLGRVRAVFLAAREDFEGGYLTSVRNLLHAEVLDSALEQAKELLAAGYTSASAVLAGVVLESALRRLCERHEISPGRLDRMNADLAKAGCFNMIVQKRITALASIRNSAAHGNRADFKAEDVASMIQEVERLVGDFLS